LRWRCDSEVHLNVVYIVKGSIWFVDIGLKSDVEIRFGKASKYFIPKLSGQHHDMPRFGRNLGGSR